MLRVKEKDLSRISYLKNPTHSATYICKNIQEKIMKKYIIDIFYISLFAILIFGFRFLPLQDYPVLLYQGFVFNEFIFHGNTFCEFWHLHSYIPPNAISTIVLGLMDLLIEPFIAGKIYLFLLAVSLYYGIVRYLSFHLNRRSMAFHVVAFFLTISLHFLMAFLNFLTGLAILFHLIVFIYSAKPTLHPSPMGEAQPELLKFII